MGTPLESNCNNRKRKKYIFHMEKCEDIVGKNLPAIGAITLRNINNFDLISIFYNCKSIS